MLKIINRLRETYSIPDIENALIQFFLRNNNLYVYNNQFLKGIETKKKAELIEINSILNREMISIDIHELASIFEMLIPDEDKKINGAFYTPRKITKLIIDEVVTSANQLICDPSCGCGAFLIEAALKLSNEFGKDIIDVIQDNIYGVDIADYSIKRAKVLLSLLALTQQRDVTKIEFNLQSMDSLEVNWKRLFPNIFENGGFDIVIGNPPYVKFQDLPDRLRKSLYYDWTTLKKGTYNLYFAFFELGVKILRKEGILGYITPNNYFTSIAGIHLREFLINNGLIRKIVDFNHLLLFNVQTYTCITILNKIRENEFLFERIENYDDYERLISLNNLKYSEIENASLNNRKWRLLRQIDKENIKIIESLNKLGKLVDIRVGIATLKDVIYFVDGATYHNGYYKKGYNGKEYLIEADITKPVVKISDFNCQEELNKNTRRIIFPYKLINKKAILIDEKELKDKYPETYVYLLAAKNDLEKREKGNGHYLAWYAYGRTQALTFHGPKLVTPTFSTKPRFLYERNPDSLFCNGYAIYLKKQKGVFSEGINLNILAKILNSQVMDYYISRTSVSIAGGYPCYQKNFIELFGIPELSKEDHELLKNEKDGEALNNFLKEKYRINI